MKRLNDVLDKSMSLKFAVEGVLYDKVLLSSPSAPSPPFPLVSSFIVPQVMVQRIVHSNSKVGHASQVAHVYAACDSLAFESSYTIGLYS